MDFYRIKEITDKKGNVSIFPEFRVGRSKDLMVRGKKFYAVWNAEKELWSTDEYDVQYLVDKELWEYKKKSKGPVTVKSMAEFSSNSWLSFRNYLSHVSDNSHDLDCNLTFSNTVVKKTDYVSKRLSYPLTPGSYDAFDEIIGTLYSEEERQKLEWAIGAIVAGDAKNIQKFLVLYGESGAGKSTILNIIQKLFESYYAVFEAKELTGSNNSFATGNFKTNPLVAIQHDGDLSRIEDNTKLNSIVSHEELIINEKYETKYSMRINSFLFMATNKPVKITDGKSGIIRRLIDVRPSGKKIPSKRYDKLMEQINFELGAIAYHCMEVYQSMGKDYYNNYFPIDMMYKTDPFFNFVEDSCDVFRQQDGVTLKAAYAMYKDYCEESGAEYKLQMYKFREELKNYFSKFEDVAKVNDKLIRSYYSGFHMDKFERNMNLQVKEDSTSWLSLKEQISIFDKVCDQCPAQYATVKEIPSKKWDEVKTTLFDLDTSKVHYVKCPETHIVIDFDLCGEDGNKSLEKNIAAASKFPQTYAEVSKGGEGLHLHYIYDGDVNNLSRIYDEHIEIKVFIGNSSLRRKLSKCNDLPIATINSGLPLKGDKVVNFESIKNEKGLRTIIRKNLNKEIHPGTKPSIDFINKVLEDAYKSGVSYDVTDMRPAISSFAAKSTNQALYCIKVVNKMKFKSELEPIVSVSRYVDEKPIFYDVEVFPNLFIVNWKKEGVGNAVVRMINPSPTDIEDLLKYKLIGFNCRRYDNHIMYARMMGYSNEQLYNLSQRIIKGSSNCFFSEAYSLSYTDIYDFSSKKQSLKKFEIELGLHHQELGLPWDEPVPEEKWIEVAEYCDNDVIATEETFKARKADWIARQILAKLSGLTVNDTTNQHSARIIFGTDRKPQEHFVYTDLSEMFPGYTFEYGKSMYRGIEVGEGGCVYAEPGMYGNVGLKDIASMHPKSIEMLNLFGKYTKRFTDIRDARIAIKHEDFEAIKHLMDGQLVPFYSEAILPDADFTLEDLAYALKIVINMVYGMTSAKFDNLFRDPRNVDNIVAKRGALFMINLKEEVQKRGYTVAHIKTDSIKIPDATPEILDFVSEYGKQYGYEFEHEATYDRMCLVNDAVYIAKYASKETCTELYGYIPSDNKKHPNEWTATGTQFQVPYVFKTLFSKENIEFEDMCETKSVTSSLYLDMNENLVEDHDYHFIGKVGQFCPIKPGCGGGILYREKDGKYYAATGSKGYRWLESEIVKNLNKQNDIDRSYYERLVNESVSTISKYGDFEWFVSNDKYISPPFMGSRITGGM